MVDITPLLAFALARFGVIRRHDALRFASSDQLLRLTKRGIIRKVQPDIYVVAAAPRCWEQQVRIAAWSLPQAHVSCEAAARIYGLRAASTSTEVVLNAPVALRGRTRECEVRYVKVMTSARVIDGVTVDCIERVLIDLGARSNKRKLTHYVSDAFHLRLTSIEKIKAVMNSLPTGTPGLAALRAELVTRVAADEGVRSRFEQKVLAVLRSEGFPEPVTQHELRHEGGSYFADFCWVSEKVSVEVDGPHHLHPEQVKYDRLRRNAYVAAGYKDLHFGDETDIGLFTYQLKALLPRDSSG